MPKQSRPRLDPDEVVASNEIADPSGPGQLLEVDWADGLVPEPQQVSWRVL